MSKNAVAAGLFGGMGTFITGTGLVRLLESATKTQTIVEAHLAKANSIDTGAILDAYELANKAIADPIEPTAAVFVGSVFLGAALYHLAQSYQRKE